MPCDYSRYPPNWKTERVPRIIKRADDKCEVCGVKNKSVLTSIKMWIRDDGKYKYKSLWISNKQDIIRLKEYYTESKTIKVVLTIAHLDHNETNHEVKDDKLKAMCQMCHLSYDAKEKYQRRLRRRHETNNTNN